MTMYSKEKRKTELASLTNADNADIIEGLVTDISDLTNALESVGTITEDGESATFEPTKIENTSDGYKEKFEALQRKYIDRFENGTPVPKEDKPAEPPKEDKPAESSETINDLFKEDK